MSETEWRSIGVQQSQGWIHYMIHLPGLSIVRPQIFIFCSCSFKTKMHFDSRTSHFTISAQNNHPARKQEVNGSITLRRRTLRKVAIWFLVYITNFSRKCDFQGYVLILRLHLIIDSKHNVLKFSFNRRIIVYMREILKINIGNVE